MTNTNRILIADDNQPNCELFEAYLSEIDCEVEIAIDGQQTLDKTDTFKPDLILLDVMMPKLSGFEVCKKLKSAEETRGIMILMVTALSELGDIERAVDAGTNDFLTKPVNKVELLKRVENMLQLKSVSDENERLRQYIEAMEQDETRASKFVKHHFECPTQRPHREELNTETVSFGGETKTATNPYRDPASSVTKTTGHVASC